MRTGNGRVDVTRYATVESRRKGGLARAAKIREEKLTVRGRLARIAEEEAHSIAGVFLEAMRAEDEQGRPDHAARVRAATAFLAEAFGRPVQAVRDETERPVEVVYSSTVLDVLMSGEVQDARLGDGAA